MRILLVEDHRDIAENIFDYLEPRGHTLDYAGDGVEGLRLALAGHFDVIVLDLMLPGKDGLQVCREFRERSPVNVPILMLTARDTLEDKLEGFEAGADDYLVKPFSLQELEARITALDRRARNAGQAAELQVADLTFDTQTLAAQRGGKSLHLSTTTRKLLALLMRNSHRVVRREEIEHELWEDEPPEGEVLRAHVYALRNIVDKPFERKLIHTVHGEGYRLCEPDDQ
ncbi:MAG: response regulator transcription factor [Gammaproteobacteria bacterium]|nr:response regulator transcription factor [Gammaproteobacteria bacterium]